MTRRVPAARILFALAAAALLSATAVRPADAAPDGKTWTLYILGGGSLLYEGGKLLVDNHFADKDRDTARRFADAASTPPPSAPPDVVFALKKPWSSIRYALIYAIANADPTVNLTAVSDPTKNSVATPRDEINVVATCANEWIYAKADPNNKVDCAKSVGNDLGIDLGDTSSAFLNAPPMQQQIVDSSLATYKVEDGLRRSAVKLLAVRLIQTLLPTPPPPGFVAAGATPMITDYVSDCLVSSSLSTAKCITDIGQAEAGAATAHRAKDACSFARSLWLPSFSAIRNPADDQIKKPSSASSAPWGLPKSTVPDPSQMTISDYGPVPGCQ